MKHYLLREAPAGSGVFQMTGELVEISAAEASALCVARQEAEGCRYGLMPYAAMAATTAPAEVAKAEQAVRRDD
jgi:hypothetical protein